MGRPANPNPHWDSDRNVWTVDLTEVDHALLTAATTHTGLSEAEVIGEALKCLFVHYPRPSESAREER
jgi:hypothetical protein